MIIRTDPMIFLKLQEKDIKNHGDRSPGHDEIII